MAISEMDPPKLAINHTNIKPLSFLDAQRKVKLVSTNLEIKSLPTLNSENNLNIIKSPSFFSDPKNITALRREHIRTSKPNDRAAKLVSIGLHILDNMVCLENPSNLDVDHMNRLALAFFKQAARAGNAFGMYLEGVAKLYGFCSPLDIPSGLKQIQEAAKLKCAEAQHFLALCSAKSNFIMCYRMLKDAAGGGHPQALINLNASKKSLLQLVAKAKKNVIHRERLRHRRMQRRKRQNSYASARRNVLTY